MPRSKQRKHHHDHHPHPTGTKKQTTTRSAVKVAVVFFSILGIGIAYFAMGDSIPWLLLGLAGGGTSGYFFGKQIDRSLANK